MKCNYCGTELENGVLFCHNCGNAVDQSKKNIQYCRECGTKLVSNSTFCSVCGAKVLDIDSIIRDIKINETSVSAGTQAHSDNTLQGKSFSNDHQKNYDDARKGKKAKQANKSVAIILIVFLFLLPFIPQLLEMWKDKNARGPLTKEELKTDVIATPLKPSAVPTNIHQPSDSPSLKPTIEPRNTPVPTDIPTPTHTSLPTDTPKPTATPSPTHTSLPTDTPEPTATPSPTRNPNLVSYSTNDKNKVRNGNSGVYSYRSRGGSYYIYYIIDFDKGYVYYFTDGNGSETCDRVKIESGDLNSVLIFTYHDGETKWSEGLHFKWSRQPDHLIHQGYNGDELDLYPTNLEDALKLREKKTIYDY